jgi:hypothetical protein
MKLPMTVVIDADNLLQRHPANPILESKEWPYRINSVFHAGATLVVERVSTASTGLRAMCS